VDDGSDAADAKGRGVCGNRRCEVDKRFGGATTAHAANMHHGGPGPRSNHAVSASLAYRVDPCPILHLCTLLPLYFGDVSLNSPNSRSALIGY
jgi:hypothetical protein